MSELPVAGQVSLRKVNVRRGSFDPATATPRLINGTGRQGDQYTVSSTSWYNFQLGLVTTATGQDAEPVRTGDIVYYEGTSWKIEPAPVDGPFRYFVVGVNLPVGVVAADPITNDWVESWYEATVPAIKRRTGDKVFTPDGVWELSEDGFTQISDLQHTSVILFDGTGGTGGTPGGGGGGGGDPVTGVQSIFTVTSGASSLQFNINDSASVAAEGETITARTKRVYRGSDNTGALLYSYGPNTWTNHDVPSYQNDIWGDVYVEVEITDSAGNTAVSGQAIQDLHVVEVTVESDGVVTPAPNHTLWTDTNTFGAVQYDWGAGFTTDPAPGPVASFGMRYVTWLMRYFDLSDCGLQPSFWDIDFAAVAGLARLSRFFLNRNPQLGSCPSGKETNMLASPLSGLTFISLRDTGMTTTPDFSLWGNGGVIDLFDNDFDIDETNLWSGLTYIDFGDQNVRTTGQTTAIDLSPFSATLQNVDIFNHDNLPSLDLSGCSALLDCTLTFLGFHVATELVFSGTYPLFKNIQLTTTGIPTAWSGEVDFTMFPAMENFVANFLSLSRHALKKPLRLLNIPTTLKELDLRSNGYTQAEVDQLINDLSGVVPSTPEKLDLTGNPAPTQNAAYDAVAAAWGAAFLHS